MIDAILCETRRIVFLFNDLRRRRTSKRPSLVSSKKLFLGPWHVMRRVICPLPSNCNNKTADTIGRD